MAFIVEQYTGDQGIQIGVEDVIRPFSFGTNWQKVRVGCRIALNGSGSLGDASLYGVAASGGPRIGVCTGSLGALASSATDVVYGACWANFDITIGGTAPLRYYRYNSVSAFNFFRCFQRVNTTTTTFGSSSLATPAISANPTALRTNYFIDFTKGTIGNSTIAMTLWYMTTANVVSDRTQGDFLAAMENESAPALMSAYTLSSPTLPIRFVKDWDSMLVGWNRSTPTACVYDICVVRFA